MEESTVQIEDDRGRDALERAHLVRRVGVTEDVTACLVGGRRRVVVVAEGVPELDVRVLGSKNIVGRWGWGLGGGGGHRFLAEPRCRWGAGRL